MVIIRICRKTGKEISVTGYESPNDQPIEKLISIAADIIMNSDEFKQRMGSYVPDDSISAKPDSISNF